MVISIVAAYAWGVLQLIVLGSFARTVRIRTVYAALAVGLYLCAPLTVVLQASWTGLVAPLLGMSAPELVRAASYTVDPFLEELMKMLPLALLMLVPTFRRQWSFTDFVLIGAATGAGFGLAEDLYRFGASADRAEGIAGGWALVFSQGYLFVPSIFKTLTSWLPVGVAGGTSDVARLNVHLVWSSVVGLAVGLTVLSRTKASRLTALGLLVCISLDHAAGNMSDVGNSWLFFLSWPLAALVHLRGLMPIAALAVALWLDQRRQGVRDSVDLLLQTERSAPSRLKGTLVAAFSRPPWSLIAVDRFVRMRRAVLTERTAATAQADTLGALVMTERDRVDRELAQWQTDVPALFPPGWTLSSLGVALRRPAVILWLVILTPSVLWFVIGGWPQTAGLQVFMKQPAVWMVLFPVSVLAQAWIAWRTIAGLRSWSLARDASVGDDAATVGLRVACGIGAVSLGAFSLLRMLGGITPGSSIFASLHAQDAANHLTPAGGSMLAGSAGAFAPPPPTLELPDTAGASAGSSSGASSGTSNSNADSGRTSTPHQPIRRPRPHHCLPMRPPPRARAQLPQTLSPRRSRRERRTTQPMRLILLRLMTSMIHGGTRVHASRLPMPRGTRRALPTLPGTTPWMRPGKVRRMLTHRRRPPKPPRIRGPPLNIELPIPKVLRQMKRPRPLVLPSSAPTRLSWRSTNTIRAANLIRAERNAATRLIRRPFWPGSKRTRLELPPMRLKPLVRRMQHRGLPQDGSLTNRDSTTLRPHFHVHIAAAKKRMSGLRHCQALPQALLRRRNGRSERVCVVVAAPERQ